MKKLLDNLLHMKATLVSCRAFPEYFQKDEREEFQKQYDELYKQVLNAMSK